MSFQNEKIQECFARLELRLYEIKNKKLDPEKELSNKYVFEPSITDILDGIFKIDFEEAQSYLLNYKDDIDKISSNLDPYFTDYSLDDAPKEWTSYDFKISRGTDRKQQFETALITELKYYLTELDNIFNRVVDRASQLGDARFSNAGFKIKLNLTVEEIGYLFNLFFNSGLIVKELPSDTTALTKEELGSFISKNFSSCKADNISKKSLVNCLTYSNAKAEGTILQWLTDLSAIADNPNKTP